MNENSSAQREDRTLRPIYKICRKPRTTKCVCLRTLHNRSLVIDDFPIRSASPPNGGSPSDAWTLGERVGEEIVVGGDLEAVEVLCLPIAFSWRMNSMVLGIFVAPGQLI